MAGEETPILLAAVLLDMSDRGRRPRRLPLDHRRQAPSGTGRLPPGEEPAVTFLPQFGVRGANWGLLVGRDDHVAFGLAVVADALQGVGLGQLVDHLAVFPVHGRETVAPLWLLSL